MLSRYFIGVPQTGQYEGGNIIDSLRGRRYMITFRKEPKDKPKKQTINRDTTNSISIFSNFY